MTSATEQGLAALLLALAMMGQALAAPPPPPPPPSGTALDLSPFFDEVDTNHDGCISEKEWFVAKLPKSAYSMLKDGSGCVTLKAMQTTAPPPGIDLNGDGKLTASEMREFDRRGPPGQPAPSR
jgi:hypothetical protein